jgi:hypothetical protein
MKEDVASSGQFGGVAPFTFSTPPVTVDRASTLYTYKSNLYPITGQEFGKHDTVKNSAKEYARGKVHTNSIENVFSVFKRGMIGVYQHCGQAHLHRYLAEFDFR